jgi:ligand-binding sensor domain-containing protein
MFRTTRSKLIVAIVAVILTIALEELVFYFCLRSSWQFYFPEDGIQNMAVDSKGQIWITRLGVDGYAVFDGETWRSKSFLESSGINTNDISTIAFDHQGRVWIGTDLGIRVLDGKAITSYNIAVDSKYPQIDAMIEDSQKHMWVWMRSGAQVFDGEKFESYDLRGAIPSGGRAVDIAKDSLGRIWVGFRGESFWGCYGRTSVNGGDDISAVSMYDGQGWKSYSWKEMGFKEPYTIQAITVDLKNQLWVGTTGGLHVFDGKVWKTIFEEIETYNDTPTEDIKCIEDMAVDPQGRLWILMEYGRLGIFDGEKWLRLDERHMYFPSGDHISIDPSGHAWIASPFSGGIMVASTEHPPIYPLGLSRVRYWFTFILVSGFMILLGWACARDKVAQKVPNWPLWVFISFTYVILFTRAITIGNDNSTIYIIIWAITMAAIILGMCVGEILRLTKLRVTRLLLVILTIVDITVLGWLGIENGSSWSFLGISVLCVPPIFNFLIGFGWSKLKIYWLLKVGIVVILGVIGLIETFYFLMSVPW